MLEASTIRSVLVISPHGDDESLGAGGLIAGCQNLGVPVHVLFFALDASSHYGLSRDTLLEEREAEVQRAADLLGFSYRVVYSGKDMLERLDTLPLRALVDTIENELDERRPDLVVVPHGQDYDQDHVACFRASLAALRPIPEACGKHFASKVVTYEMPKLEWSPEPFRPNVYLRMNEEVLARKCAAIEAYVTQVRDPPHIRSLENIRRLAGLRGAEAGVEYAEAYQALRWIIS